jgi:hypothetical protein
MHQYLCKSHLLCILLEEGQGGRVPSCPRRRCSGHCTAERPTGVGTAPAPPPTLCRQRAGCLLAHALPALLQVRKHLVLQLEHLVLFPRRLGLVRLKSCSAACRTMSPLVNATSWMYSES